MLNEGLILNDTRALLKSEMLRQIRRLGPTTPDLWERAVFQALTGQTREDVDWDFEDNQAGYFLWLKSFDQLIAELIEDGQVRDVALDGSPQRTLLPVEAEPPLEFSHLVYPASAGGG